MNSRIASISNRTKFLFLLPLPGQGMRTEGSSPVSEALYTHGSEHFRIRATCFGFRSSKGTGRSFANFPSPFFPELLRPGCQDNHLRCRFFGFTLGGVHLGLAAAIPVTKVIYDPERGLTHSPDVTRLFPLINQFNKSFVALSFDGDKPNQPHSS